MYRTHTCGELTKKDIKKQVMLAGWSHSRRDHGGVIFIDLRDRYGLTQIVFDPSHNKEVHKQAEHIGREWVLCVKGRIRNRPKGMVNQKLKTGEIEVLVDELRILNKSAVPPLDIDDRTEANEDVRLRYRYLDLRKPKMQFFLAMRHKAAQAARAYLNKEKFLEIESPLLVKSTPEGARDYIVPSRVNPGKFYALPQSPQLYKQILMISGLDRYYQLARCLRDEDLRADRQPEHTQIDLEMSFVEQEDVMNAVEGLYVHIWKEVLKKSIGTPFKKISYAESMEKYGTDKPDLRFGMELVDVTEAVKKSDFSIFKKAEQVKCINAEKDMARKEIDSLIEWAKKEGADGLAWLRATKNGLESSIAKYFDNAVQKELMSRTKAKKGILFFVAGKPAKVAEIMPKLRNELARRLDLVKKEEFAFCWVTDFPLFKWSAEENKWNPMHHMFTSPKKEDEKNLEKDPSKVRGNLYDLVLNGSELGSGSIRITDPELQEKVMKVTGMTKEEAKTKFGFLMEAFKYGAPPHGGIGIGVDRTVALMLGFNDIREVIAFPKNKNAECPMDGSPSDIDEKQLKELHIRKDK